MPQDKKVIVYENDAAPPRQISEFMNFWQMKIDLIPDEFKDSAKISIEALDADCLRIEIVYTRPETPEEEAARQSVEDEKQAKRRQEELGLLERLKEKYENTSPEKIKIREQDTKGKDELFCRWWECPSCKGTYIWRGCDFCPTCGKALEFDFEDKPLFAEKTFGGW